MFLDDHLSAVLPLQKLIHLITDLDENSEDYEWDEEPLTKSLAKRQWKRKPKDQPFLKSLLRMQRASEPKCGATAIVEYAS